VVTPEKPRDGRGVVRAAPAAGAASVSGRYSRAVTEPIARSPDRELDELTLERARRGDPAARKALVVRYQAPVFALLGRYLGATRPHEIEDLAQDTFLRVFRELGSFRPDGAAKLSTWILTIATRLAIDAHRKGRRSPIEPGSVEHVSRADASAPEDSAMRSSLGRTIASAVAAMPEEYRMTFLLREYHELGYREIAEVLEIDVGTVKSRLSRARTLLRDALREEAP
jgi:RNA polymerase sigma-70 factor (ECF subfamily)